MRFLGHLALFLFALFSVAATPVPKLAFPMPWEIIVRNIANIELASQKLSRYVKNWDGTMMNSIDISTQTELLLQMTKDAVVDIENNSPKLSIPEAHVVQFTTKKLIKATENCVNCINFRRDDFHKIGIDATAKQNMIDQASASANMTAATLKKLPFPAGLLAKPMTEKVKTLFANSILWFSMCPVAMEEPCKQFPGKPRF